VGYVALLLLVLLIMMTAAAIVAQNSRASDKVSLRRLERELASAHKENDQYKMKLRVMLDEYRILERRANMRVNKSPVDKKLVTDLITLCHPDKHDGSPKSTRVTQTLLSLRDTL
jgi:hypothetical protein